MGQVFPVRLVNTVGTNSDGTVRHIGQLNVGDHVEFVRDSRNPNIVVAVTARGTVIGEVGDDAKWMGRALGKRQTITGTITSVSTDAPGEPVVIVEGRLVKQPVSGAAKGCLIAAAVCLGMFVALVVGVAIYGEINPEWKARMDREAAERRAASEAEDKREAAAAAASSATANAANAANNKDAVQRFWREVIRHSNYCQQGVERATTALQSNNVIDAYDAAKRAEAACRDASGDIRRLSIPNGVSDSTEEALEKAKTSCVDLQNIRSNGMDMLTDMLNGGMSVAAMSEFRQAANQTGGAQLICVAALGAAGETVGLGIEDLQRVVGE